MIEELEVLAVYAVATAERLGCTDAELTEVLAAAREGRELAGKPGAALIAAKQFLRDPKELGESEADRAVLAVSLLIQPLQR